MQQIYLQRLFRKGTAGVLLKNMRETERSIKLILDTERIHYLVEKFLYSKFNFLSFIHITTNSMKNKSYLSISNY